MVGRVARPQGGNCGCAKNWDRTLQGEPDERSRSRGTKAQSWEEEEEGARLGHGSKVEPTYVPTDERGREQIIVRGGRAFKEKFRADE